MISFYYNVWEEFMILVLYKCSVLNNIILLLNRIHYQLYTHLLQQSKEQIHKFSSNICCSEWLLLVIEL